MPSTKAVPLDDLRHALLSERLDVLTSAETRVLFAALDVASEAIAGHGDLDEDCDVSRAVDALLDELRRPADARGPIRTVEEFDAALASAQVRRG